jgi:4-aminobutyrate aminotransferase-like enzyme
MHSLPAQSISTAIATAAANATLGYIRDHDLMRNADEIDKRLWAGLVRLAADRRSIGEVRGSGLMIGLGLGHGCDSRADRLRDARKRSSASSGRLPRSPSWR